MIDQQCQHRHGDGRLCGSPRLNNKNYCYYHTRLHESFILPGNRYYTPPPLTDLHNIQLALTHIWSALSKGLISHKQACSMAYAIQLAKQTLKDIAEMQKDAQKENSCNDVILNEDLCPSEAPHNGIPSSEGSELSHLETSGPDYDPANPPLCLEPALRPLLSKEPSPDSPAVWVPISDAEYEKICNYNPLGPADALYDTYQRRRKLHARFLNNPNPTPGQITQALLEIEQEETRQIQERESAIRTIRAKKRDQRNREILGF